MARITTQTIWMKYLIQRVDGPHERRLLFFGQADDHDPEEDGEEDDLKHFHVHQGTENIFGHDVDQGLQWDRCFWWWWPCPICRIPTRCSVASSAAIALHQGLRALGPCEN